MNESEFLEFVAGIFEIPPGSLSLDVAYKSVPQWDSIMHLRLVMEIEAKYGVGIPMDKVSQLDSLRAFFDLVNRK